MSIRSEIDKLIATRKVRSLLKNISNCNLTSDVLNEAACFINNEPKDRNGYGVTLEIHHTADGIKYEVQVFGVSIFVNITSIGTKKVHRINFRGCISMDTIVYHSLFHKDDAKDYILGLKTVLHKSIADTARKRGLNV